MSVIDVIGNLAFGLSALSLLARDMLLLRMLAIASGVIALVYNAWYPTGPLWTPFFWTSATIAINAVNVAQLIWDRRTVTLDPREAELHQTVFPNLSVVEFRKLMLQAARIRCDAGHVLARAGEPAGKVWVIAQGRVRLRREGRSLGLLRDGVLIGEASVVSKKPLAVDLVCETDCDLVCWKAINLARLFARNPLVALGFERSFLAQVPPEAFVVPDELSAVPAR